MAWQETMTTMLRVVINDFETPYRYSDDRLQQTLAWAAIYVQTDIDLQNTYEVDIAEVTITPDPTTSDPPDDVFTNFVVMKAACIIDEGSLRSSSLSAGIIALAGPAKLDTKNYGSLMVDVINLTACQGYNELKHQYNFSDNMVNICRFVLTPYGSEDNCGSNFLISCGGSNFPPLPR